MHNIKGVEHEYIPSSISEIFNQIKYFMENVIGYDWVIEEVSDTRINYYLDDKKIVGFALVNTGNATTTGLYPLRGNTYSTFAKLYPGSTHTSVKVYLYGHVSEDENTVYIFSHYLGNSSAKYGAVAAKDSEDKWSVFFTGSSYGSGYDYCFVVDEEKINRSSLIGAVPTAIEGNNSYLNVDSNFCFAKCPNAFTGAEFKSLYMILATPDKPVIDSTTSKITKIYAQADGKIYRLVQLYGTSVCFAFPVAD